MDSNCCLPAGGRFGVLPPLEQPNPISRSGIGNQHTYPCDDYCLFESTASEGAGQRTVNTEPLGER